MRNRLPDFHLAMTMLWIWVGIVIALVAGWYLVKWWKLRRPAPKPELPHSQRLHTRLNERRPSKGSGHRRDKADRHTNQT